MERRKIKKVELREDLLAITGDFREAMVLNQFIYWSERVDDANLLIEQENEIAKAEGTPEHEPLHGWIYKTADQMSEEVMLGLSRQTMSKVMNSLVDKGFLSRRSNPEIKWDRTSQYKVNFYEIGIALEEQGYSLEVLSEFKHSSAQNLTFECKEMSNGMLNNEQTIPDIDNNIYTSSVNNKTNISNSLENIKEKEKYKKEKESGPADGYTKEFLEFWEAYPRKDDKSKSFNLYQYHIQHGFTDADLLKAATAYAAEMKKRKTERSYMKMCPTFLSKKDKNFRDYLENREETKNEQSAGSDDWWKDRVEKAKAEGCLPFMS